MSTIETGSRREAPRSHAQSLRAGVSFACGCLIALTAVHSTQARSQSADFTYDPTFNAPHGFNWSRGGSVGNAYGRATARMDNGNSVVVSLVPPCGQADQGNQLFSLGLELFDATGAPQAWSSPGANGCAGDGSNLSYSRTTPNSAGASAVQYIRDIKIYNGAIYVMYDLAYNQGTGDEDVQIAVFGGDGHFIEDVAATNTTMAEFGAGLVPYKDVGGNNFMTGVATIYAPGAPNIRLTNFAINADGSLSRNSAYGNGGFVDESISNCIQPHPCFTGAARAVVKQYSFEEPVIGPDIYIVGEIQWNVVSGGVKDINAIVLDVRANGSLNAAFGTGENPGVAMVAFNEEDQFEDHGRAIVAASNCTGVCGTDDIWIVDEAHTRCGIGVGIAKLDDSGHLVSGFGNGGERAFGGHLGVPICGGVLQDHPYALAFDGSRLAVVGDEFQSPGSGGFTDPMLAVVDAGNGALIDFRQQPFFNNPGGSPPPARWGDGYLFDVVANGDGTFTAAGQAHDDFFNVWNLAIARFADDTIFDNGFD